MEVLPLAERNVTTSEENSGPEAFWGMLHSSFLQAVKATGRGVEHFYDIGGFKIRLCFAGPAMIHLITPALKHLEKEPCSPVALTICLWDSISTGTKIPPPPWSKEDYLARGEIRGYNNDRVYTNFNIGSGILNMLDLGKNLAFYWIRDARKLPYYESGAPLLTVLNWWMGVHGGQIVHAGAVGTSEGGVLLIGKGGSGKSLTALTCLDSELLYAGDDYCLITTTPGPYVYSLFNSGKVSAKDVEKVSFLKGALSNAGCLGSEKALFFLHKNFSQKVTTGFPLKALLLPRVTGLPETRIIRTSASKSLSSMAPSTIFQLPGAGSKVFQSLSLLVKQLPAYTLELGTDRLGIRRAIEAFLTEQYLCR